MKLVAVEEKKEERSGIIVISSLFVALKGILIHSHHLLMSQQAT